ncbi:phosphoesterase [Streptomyces phage BillNye]|uniref:Phosphoesterase n=2 Tax=Wilnyevirus billnye TaxID=2560486 RepID=A0A2L1IVR5_9CAUD|nr:phosphoesterase [Streptomyces phage BillNye]AVD99247.1 phosphoesterase [Streptomyces phage BillNye]QBZ72331.1 phosphoesterase [Streptomyces phage Circinus]
MSDFKWAFVGDLQIPYHDERALALFFKVMKAWKPDAMDITGDIDDQLEYSSFSDGTTDEFFSQLKKSKQIEEESDADFRRRVSPLPFVRENALGARTFYTELRNDHKNCDIHVSLGNHDIRIFKYMDKKAPDYVEELTPNMLWGLDDLGISWRHYDLPPLERFGGIYVHHGATTTTTGLAVKADIENYNISLARGHDHRGGVVYKSYPMTNTTLVGLGTGHMCDPSAYGLRYTINPSWELGFGIGHVVDGVASLQFIPISPDYTCVVDGKIFKG